METRTRWRKAEPGVREGVVAVLDALRDGIGAEALGLFDDDRAELDAAGQPEQLNFWEAFGGLPCVQLDWARWYGALKADGRVESPCACGEGHRVQGFLIHERWALLVVAPATLSPGAAASILSSVKALTEKLPPAKKPAKKPALGEPELPVPDPGRFASGAPLWWVRKTRQ